MKVKLAIGNMEIEKFVDIDSKLNNIKIIVSNILDTTVYYDNETLPDLPDAHILVFSYSDYRTAKCQSGIEVPIYELVKIEKL